MKIVITGGDGFLGSHLTEHLVEQGHEVVVIGRFPYEKSRNLEHLREQVKLVHADLNHPDRYEIALASVDVVNHLAASSNPVLSWNDPIGELETHVKPTLHLVEAAVRRGVKKIVFASSGGTVYGASQHPIDENAKPEPFSPYGIAKMSQEYYLHHYQQANGLQYDIYRISNVYGPRQKIANRQGVIATWMHQILHDEPLEVYGDEKTLRDYIHVKDVAHLMGHSLLNTRRSETYNLGTGRGVSILELLRIFQQSIPKSFEVVQHPRRSSDNQSIVLDNAKLLECFPDYRFRTLEEEIPRLWEEIQGKSRIRQ